MDSHSLPNPFFNTPRHHFHPSLFSSLNYYKSCFFLLDDFWNMTHDTHITFVRSHFIPKVFKFFDLHNFQFTYTISCQFCTMSKQGTCRTSTCYWLPLSFLLTDNGTGISSVQFTSVFGASLAHPATTKYLNILLL